MKSKAGRWIIGIVILGLIALLLVPKFLPKESATTGAAAAPPPATVVSAIVIEDKSIRSQSVVSGTLLPSQEVSIRAEASGRVVRIGFREGEQVSAGTELIKLDDAELQAQLKRALSDKDLSASRIKRQETLLKKEAISQQEYEEAVNEVNQVQAQIELIRAQIAKTVIRAPFTGKIGLSDVEIGSYLTAGTEIGRMVSTSPLKLEFSVPEAYAQNFSRGSEVRLTVGGRPGQYAGKIDATDAVIDPQTRTLKMRALIDNKNGGLIAGSYAQVELPIGKARQAPLIPALAIVPAEDGSTVYLSRGGKAMIQKVELGLRTDDKVEVMEGLQTGDTVIVSGIISLKPGTPVSTNIIVQ